MIRHLLVALVTSGAVALASPATSLAQNRGRTSTRSDAGAQGGGQARGRADAGSGRRAADAPSSGGDSTPRATARPRDGSNTRRPDGGAGSGAADKPGTGEATGSRPRDDQRTSAAVSRRSVPRSGGEDRSVIVIDRGYRGGGLYPWGYGGLGLGGYYGGRYDPWWWSVDEPYWASGAGYDYESEGSIRLRVNPPGASVYVDGYFAGRVDDFDGFFQSLRIESGPHRIEVQRDGFAPLTFEVWIQPDHKVTYTDAMKPLP